MLRIEQGECHPAQIRTTAPLLATGWRPQIKLPALRPPTILTTSLWPAVRLSCLPSLSETALYANLFVALLP